MPMSSHHVLILAKGDWTEGDALKHAAVEVKEFDGGRSMYLSARDGYIFLDFGDRCYAFDRKLIFHASERALDIGIFDMDGVGDAVEALTY